MLTREQKKQNRENHRKQWSQKQTDHPENWCAQVSDHLAILNGKAFDVLGENVKRFKEIIRSHAAKVEIPSLMEDDGVKDVIDAWKEGNSYRWRLESKLDPSEIQCLLDMGIEFRGVEYVTYNS